MWDGIFGLDQMTVPIWAIAAAIVLFLVVGSLAVWRAGPRAAIAASSQAALVLVLAGATWSFISQSSLRDRADERRALDARAQELTARAVLPGSALACLEALAGDMVENACEKALFANAETAAAAIAYIAARLTLLADAMAYAERRDPGYEPVLADWRRRLEGDRFGLVAHVMATRDGCTADQCEALHLLRDTSRVSANLKDGAFDQHVARYASAWGTNAGTPVAAANAPAAPPPPSLAASSSSGPIFPSSASIPPVSIMNAEPTGAVQPVPSGAPAMAPAASVAATAEPLVNPPTPPRRPRRPPPAAPAEAVPPAPPQ